jgi:membrane-associated phospholipid phosphatase
MRKDQALMGISATATAAFGVVALASATRRSAHVDRTLAPRMAFRSQSRGRKLANRISPAGKWYVIVPVASALGAMVALSDRRRRSAGVAIVASAVSATLLGKLFDATIPQPPVPAGHRGEPRKAVFPSGHGLISSAASLTSAYVLVREDLASPFAALPFAVLFPLVNTGMKLGAKKHWPSDALGGLVAGLAISAGCCAVYERSLTRTN